jgi:hypothetical protein
MSDQDQARRRVFDGTRELLDRRPDLADMAQAGVVVAQAWEAS